MAIVIVFLPAISRNDALLYTMTKEGSTKWWIEHICFLTSAKYNGSVNIRVQQAQTVVVMTYLVFRKCNAKSILTSYTQTWTAF